MRGVKFKLLVCILLLAWAFPFQAQDNLDLHPLPFAAVTGDSLWLYGFSTFPREIATNLWFDDLPQIFGQITLQGVWSPDGNLFAYRRYESQLQDGQTYPNAALLVYDRRDNTTREIPGNPTPGVYPGPFTFSLDSKAVLVSGSDANGTPTQFYKIDLAAANTSTVYADTGIDCGPRGGGGGAGYLPLLRYYQEVGFPGYTPTLLETPQGIFFDVVCNGRTVGFYNTQTKTVTDFGTFRRAASSVNRTWIAGIGDDTTLKMFNVLTGVIDEYSLAAKPDVLAVSREGVVYYSTRTERPAANSATQPIFDITIRRFDPTSGEDTEIFVSEEYAVGRLALTPDGRELIFSLVPTLKETIDGPLTVEDIRSTALTELYRLNLENPSEGAQLVAQNITAFVFNPVAYSTGFTGPALYSIPREQTYPSAPIDESAIRRELISAANVPNLALIAVLQRPDVDEVLWSPGGRTMAVAGGSSVWLYDTRDFRIAPRVLTHVDKVLDMDYNPDGQLLATAINGGLNIYTVQEGSLLDSVLLNAHDIAYSPDGSLIAYASPFGDIGWYNPLTGETRVIKRGDGQLMPVGLAFSRRGDTLAVGQANSTVELYDVRTATLRTTFNNTTIKVSGGGGKQGQDPRDGLAYSDDGRTLAAVDLHIPRSLTVWDVTSGTPLQTLQSTREGDFGGETFFTVEFNTRAGLLAAASGDYDAGNANHVKVWQTASGTLLNELPHPGGRSVTFSPDGTLMATAGGGSIRLWGAASGLPTVAQARAFSNINVVTACDNFEITTERISPRQSISLVWSWYATTPELVQDHIDAVQYSVTVDGLPLTAWQYVTKIENDPVNDDNPTIYWYTPIGRLSEGQHIVRYTATWTKPISDGFADFGPDTANPREEGSCVFVVG